MKDKVSNLEDYDKIKHTSDKFSLLKIIKQLVYSNLSVALHTVHNQVKVTINLSSLVQKCHQSPETVLQAMRQLWRFTRKMGLQTQQVSS